MTSTKKLYDIVPVISIDFDLFTWDVEYLRFSEGYFMWSFAGEVVESFPRRIGILGASIELARFIFFEELWLGRALERSLWFFEVDPLLLDSLLFVLVVLTEVTLSGLLGFSSMPVECRLSILDFVVHDEDDEQ